MAANRRVIGSFDISLKSIAVALKANLLMFLRQSAGTNTTNYLEIGYPKDRYPTSGFMSNAVLTTAVKCLKNSMAKCMEPSLKGSLLRVAGRE